MNTTLKYLMLILSLNCLVACDTSTRARNQTIIQQLNPYIGKSPALIEQQLDLQNMRSEKFGYEAPIEVYERRFYRYSDPDYSIHHISVNENDLKTMNNAVQILK